MRTYTARELIEELQEYDPNTKVKLNTKDIEKDTDDISSFEIHDLSSDSITGEATEIGLHGKY